MYLESDVLSGGRSAASLRFGDMSAVPVWRCGGPLVCGVEACVELPYRDETSATGTLVVC